MKITDRWDLDDLPEITPPKRETEQDVEKEKENAEEESVR